MVKTVRAWLRRGAYLILLILAVLIVWMGAFVHPNPARVPDPLRILEGVKGPHKARLHVHEDLLFRLDEAWTRVPNLEKGHRLLESLDFFADYPFVSLEDNSGLAVSMTQGKHAMFLEQRNAIYAPTPADIFYKVDVPQGAKLRFGLSIQSRVNGVETAPVEFKVFVTDENGEDRVELLSDTLRPEPIFPWSEEDFFYHTFLKFIRIDSGFWNGRWYDHEIDLGDYAGRKIGLLFTARVEGNKQALSHGFISSPRIYAPDETSKPNIVVAVMDTLRSDYVGANNPEAAGLTPNIDSVAREGITFQNTRSQGNWSRGSFASIFTGLPVPGLGFSERWSFTREEKKIYNKRRHPSLADVLRKEGYTTVSVGNNPFVYDGSGVGLHLGFDQAIDIQREPYDTEFSTAEAIRWLKNRGDERFFMMFTLNSAHSPFRPPFKYILQGWMWSKKHLFNPQAMLYRAVVAYADDYFGKFKEALDRLGLADNTILVVIADHGVILFRDGAIRAKPGGDYDWIEATHTHTLYEEETRVPLIVEYPGRPSAQKSTNRMTALLDIAPTVAEFADARLDPRWSGESFAGMFEGVDASSGVKKKRVVTAAGEGVWSIVTDDGFKYLRRSDPMARMLVSSGEMPISIKEEVYDLNRDPEERHDISQSAPEIVTRLRRVFAREYPSEVDVYKLLIRSVEGDKNLALHLKTDGRFIFLDAPDEEGFEVEVIEHGEGERVVKLEGIKTYARIFFETQPVDADVSIEVLDGEGRPAYSGGIRTGPLAIRSGVNPVKLSAGKNSFYLSDPDGLVSDAATEDGVYVVTIPFSQWRASSEGGVKLDPELESMMRKWGYL